MTHEFRTPVNSILALTTLLTERLGTPPEHKDELYYIRKSAQQLSDIVNDLLDLAKVEAGKIEVRPQVFEVPALFGALRGMLRPLLAQLPPRERTIIALRFFRQLTQTQIAEQVGISQMHVSRVLRQTLAYLHEQMAGSD